MAKDHLALYLNRYAETQSLEVAKNIPESFSFDRYLIIPAFDEEIDFIEALKNNGLSQQKTLIIVVINQPQCDYESDDENSYDDDHDGSSAHNKATQKNLILWNHLKNSQGLITLSEKFLLAQWPDTNTSILAVDCFSPEQDLPKKQGVGLARKIGCDIACSLIAKQASADSWIHTTDADTQLPEDYFDNLPEDKYISALTYPYQHIGNDSNLTKATLLYEASLHYYVDGLSYAHSPYAFHTLGSCIAVRANYYAQARGFPKRAGGEDFYLLNKLAKLGAITQKQGKPLLIKARKSNRAPFGTGVAVEKILNRDYNENTLPAYHPDVFVELKILLSNFNDLYQYRENFEEWLSAQSKPCQTALNTLGVSALFSHLSNNCKNEEQWRKQTIDWLDGFRTLKFIHYLEEHYPKTPFKAARKILTRLKKEQ